MSKATIKPFKNIYEYCEFWDGIVEKALNDTDNTEYAQLIRNQVDYVNERLSSNPNREEERIRLIKEFGEPLPADNEDAMRRRSFLNMPLYNNVYAQLSPFLSALEKISTGILPKDVIRPNDREMGVFSLDRALMSPKATPSLYCEKENKYYGLSEGTLIYDKDGKISLDKQGRQRHLLKNKKEAVLKQLVENGRPRWGSANKKSFLYKEKVPRPHRVVRLFVLVGAHAGEQTYWAGVTAVICASFLETKGYAVRVTAVMNVSRDRGMNMDKNPEKLTDGVRYSMIDVKLYNEQLDSLSLLYTMADPSFFRVRQFAYYHASQWLYQDEAYYGIGQLVSSLDFRNDFYEKIKLREIAEEKNTLYYFFGGQDCVSIENAKRDLVTIICDAERQNRKALQNMGFDFSKFELEDPINIEGHKCNPTTDDSSIEQYS